MPRDVNVTFVNRRLTGTNVSVPQRAVDFVATWTKDDGTQGSDTRTILFPNILTNANIPAGWLADELEQLCYRAVRIIVGIDQP
jgi:hypothetical protein